MFRVSGLRFVLMSILVFATSGVLAQVPDGSINGLVTDPKDAVVAGARVTAVSASQGVSHSTVSNSSGLYVLSNLPSGTYDLRIEQPGFAANEFKGIVIEAGRSTTVDARLQIASAGATVDVNASNVNLDLTQSMIQGQITSTTIESIPLNGRNFLELAYLVPGNRPAPTFDPTKTNTLEVSSAGGLAAVATSQSMAVTTTMKLLAERLQTSPKIPSRSFKSLPALHRGGWSLGKQHCQYRHQNRHQSFPWLCISFERQSQTSRPPRHIQPLHHWPCRYADRRSHSSF